MTVLKIGETEKKLLDASLIALKNAYVLWGFKVGAAVFAEDGQVYEGCNVETWVSGLGTCAERCAINHAVLHGNRKIKELAVVMDANSGANPDRAARAYSTSLIFQRTRISRSLWPKQKKGRF